MMKNMSCVMLLTTVAVNTAARLPHLRASPRLRPPSGTLDFQAAFCSVLAFSHAVLKI